MSRRATFTSSRQSSHGGGLYLWVRDRGRLRSWIFRYAVGGRVREMSLGAAAVVPFKQAGRSVNGLRALIGPGDERPFCPARNGRPPRSFRWRRGGPDRMVRTVISVEAFEAIARTLPVGSVGYENEANERGEKLISLDRAVIDRLHSLRS
jgi:hypothetical protein